MLLVYSAHPQYISLSRHVPPSNDLMLCTIVQRQYGSLVLCFYKHVVITTDSINDLEQRLPEM